MNTMIKVWDIPTRLFHWSLVLLFIFLIISGESDDLMQWHFYAGYLLSGLILFRVMWGFLGTRYARYSSLTFNPASAVRYTKALLRAKHTAQYGHTPAGSMMILILLGLISVQLLTGLMSTDDIIWNGPLYGSVDEATAELAGEVHETVQGLLQILVGLHILAIVIYKVKFKEHLVPAMIHGKKPKLGSQPEREAMSTTKLILAGLPAIALIYWLFTQPI